jgi:hypothetical protein
VLPEQLACWSYPLATSDPDQASFNMVTAILCRIHQAERLDKISGAACGLAVQLLVSVLRNWFCTSCTSPAFKAVQRSAHPYEIELHRVLRTRA